MTFAQSPFDPFYRGAMLSEVSASVPDLRAHFAAVATRTPPAVAHDPEHVTAQLGDVTLDSDGFDPVAVEHERQSRLARWHRQP